MIAQSSKDDLSDFILTIVSVMISMKYGCRRECSASRSPLSELRTIPSANRFTLAVLIRFAAKMFLFLLAEDFCADRTA
jgi:hypothetical protein